MISFLPDYITKKKKNDFNFAILNCPYLDCNIPTVPVYGVADISYATLVFAVSA